MTTIKLLQTHADLVRQDTLVDKATESGSTATKSYTCLSHPGVVVVSMATWRRHLAYRGVWPRHRTSGRCERRHRRPGRASTRRWWHYWPKQSTCII